MKKEIIVILHTQAGEVRTAFKEADRQAAWTVFTDHLDSGKQVSMVIEAA
ncbi:hypothetical protein [Alcaligenes faecalis]|nr:hypothetical protein [Alcaligenes faecalis]